MWFTEWLLAAVNIVEVSSNKHCSNKHWSIGSATGNIDYISSMQGTQIAPNTFWVWMDGYDVGETWLLGSKTVSQ